MTTATDHARPTPVLVAKGSTVPVRAGPLGISITAGGCRACVAYNGDGSVCVIDTVVDAFPVGIAPSRVAFSPNELSSHMSDNGANAVSVMTSLRSVSPNQGATRGGIVVAVTGVNPAGATAVRFGSRPAAPIGSTRNQVTAVSPAGAGTVDVMVTTTAATGNPEPFSYVSPPPVRGADPLSGPTTGGSTATTAGLAMTAGAAVLTVPAQAAVGPVPVTVITAGGHSTVLDYTYPDTSTVTVPSPVSGPGSGGPPPRSRVRVRPLLPPGRGRRAVHRHPGRHSHLHRTCPDPRPCEPDGHYRHRQTITLPGAYTCLAVPAA